MYRPCYREVQKNGRKTERPKYGYALSGSTIRSLHGVFHQAMDAAVQERLTARNPIEDVTLPKKKASAKQILNDEQLERFMEEIKKDPVWHDFFYTELTTGMRRGEICGLMWSDFDGKKGILTVRRTLHQRKGGRLTTGETKTGKGAGAPSPFRPARTSCCGNGGKAPAPSGYSPILTARRTRQGLQPPEDPAEKC